MERTMNLNHYQKSELASKAIQFINQGFDQNSMIKIQVENGRVKTSKPITFSEYNQRFDTAPEDCFSLFAVARGLF